ncbi:ATP-binding cassette domain-containing protein [Microbacteriaceae bacterium VKM Ac-2854]|nr:ATP-binding cassette domain-containing protein [Microbacteriaceae bacterium VKM Ac-2854]
MLRWRRWKHERTLSPGTGTAGLSPRCPSMASNTHCSPAAFPRERWRTQTSAGPPSPCGVPALSTRGPSDWRMSNRAPTRRDVDRPTERSVRRAGRAMATVFTETALARLVGAPVELIHRRARELTGGQRRLIAIARALARSPRLVICDEALSALGLTTQAAIVELLDEIPLDTAVAYLFIAHDLALVRHVSDRVVVTRHGDIVEQGDAEILGSRLIAGFRDARARFDGPARSRKHPDDGEDRRGGVSRRRRVVS